MSDKKLYWLIESNGDLSAVCDSPESCLLLLESDFDGSHDDDKAECQYTITPVYYTDEEYEQLHEED